MELIITQNPKAEIIDQVWMLQNRNLPLSKWGRDYFNSYFNKSDSRRPIIVLAYEDDEIVGFILSKEKGDIFQLDSLLVRAEYRKRGVATKLIKRILKEATRKNARKVILHFRDSNNLAEFYKKFGFGNKKKAGNYKNGEIKYEMEINLKNNQKS